MTLRNRVSVAAALGVLVVVAAVSGVLYLSYAASVHSRVDPALVDAAQQATGIAQRVKQSAATDKRSGNDPALDLTVTVGSIEVQLFPGPVDAGQSTRFGPLDGRDVAVAERTSRPTSPNGATAVSGSASTPPPGRAPRAFPWSAPVGR